MIFDRLFFPAGLSLSEEPIEDSIDECGGLFSGKSFDDLQSLIDGHSWRNVIEVLQLRCSNPQGISIDDRHPAQTPAITGSVDPFVNLEGVLPIGFDQGQGKVPRIGKSSEIVQGLLSEFAARFMALLIPLDSVILFMSNMLLKL